MKNFSSIEIKTESKSDEPSEKRARTVSLEEGEIKDDELQISTSPKFEANAKLIEESQGNSQKSPELKSSDKFHSFAASAAAAAAAAAATSPPPPSTSARPLPVFDPEVSRKSAELKSLQDYWVKKELEGNQQEDWLLPRDRSKLVSIFGNFSEISILNPDFFL